MLCALRNWKEGWNSPVTTAREGSHLIFWTKMEQPSHCHLPTARLGDKGRHLSLHSHLTQCLIRGTRRTRHKAGFSLWLSQIAWNEWVSSSETQGQLVGVEAKEIKQTKIEASKVYKEGILSVNLWHFSFTLRPGSNAVLRMSRIGCKWKTLCSPSLSFV